MKFFLYGVLSLGLALVAAILIVDARNDTRNGAGSSAVPHFQTEVVRQATFTDQATVSRGQGPVLIQLVSGSIPAGVSRLTVLTDEDCTPDQDGVSHCLNRVQYETAQGVAYAAVRHHHKMSEESCLAPGETIVIVN